MPASTRWFEENKIVMTTYWGDLSLEDVINLFPEIESFLNQAPGKVDNLIDLTELQKVTFKFPDLITHPTALRVTKNPHLGWVVYFGSKDNPLFGFLTSVIAQATKHKIHMVETEAEALAFIKNMDVETIE